jgi:DNA polymerase Ligase (LigD)
MPRFVILEHDFPLLHWDLMLEAGDALRTWRLDAPPRSGVRMVAQAIAEHRMLYLDYEGPVSGDRGRVVRWDRGTFVEQVHEVDRIVARLQGERLRGILELAQQSGDRWDSEFRSEATLPDF